MKKPNHSYSPDQGESLFILRVIAVSVLLTGILTISTVLFAQKHINLRPVEIVHANARITLLVGLTFIYLASLLRKAKYSAWLIAVPLYVFLVARNLRHLVVFSPMSKHTVLPLVLNLLVPLLALVLLIVYRHKFVVRSEVRNFPAALRVTVVVLIVTFLYGVVGFQTLDQRDFHQEISIVTSAHYTVDQFNLTTNTKLTPHTHRAKLFLDSLATISAGAVFYVVISFFAPIRFRLKDQANNRETMRLLLEKYPASSEDYFKLWPYDKAYFFNDTDQAGLAYKVTAGVALVVGDPAGQPTDFKDLLIDFREYCRVNDWDVALIHTEAKQAALYEELGFNLQKIGQEAIIDIAHFQAEVAPNKYFRNISNRFVKQNYRCEVLVPPHNKAVMNRLHEISNAWLDTPGRAERGFMMGYFNEAYMQQSTIMAAYDEAGTMQAFVNQIHSYDAAEANFDLLRSTRNGLSNINDYLMLNFMQYLQSQGFQRLNMGLSPLSDTHATLPGSGSTIDSLMHLAYLGGNQFYSFSGLKKFKSKYEPDWQDRFVVHMAGLPGFSKATSALIRSMRIHRVKPNA